MSISAQNFNKRLDGREPHRFTWNKVQASGMFRPVILVLIAGILVTIAVLQYHWINQLRAETRHRIQNTLELLMNEWNFKLYGNLSAICVALQVGPDSGAHDIWDDYVQRYATWKQQETAEDPQASRPSTALVQDVYVWETSRKTPSLFLLDPNTKRIQTTEIPQNLNVLLSRLQARSKNLAGALRAWELDPENRTAVKDGSSPGTPPGHDGSLSGWQFDLTIPAIVHPLVPHRPLKGTAQPPGQEQPVDWIVVVLRSDVIDNVILPALAQRYFGGDQGLDYKLSVIDNGDENRILYSSDPGFPSRNARAFDGVMDVFEQGTGRPKQPWHEFLPQSNVAFLREGKSSMTGPAWFRVIQYTPRPTSWTLVAQRRGTSWSDVLRQVWVTNLATGIAFLALLAVSVGLVVLATRRLHNLAGQQMNFVASVSHELRTPLTIIMSAAENISDGVIENPSEVREHGLMITDQSRLLLDMVDRILLFSSSTAGKSIQLLRPVAIAEVFQKVEHNVSPLMQSSSMRLEKELPVDLPLALADPDWLSLCLQNLIANAVKYRGKSDWIGLRAEIRKSHEGIPEICIDVQDRGVGIREAELNKIFEPFYRSPSVAKSQVRGTGLGLAFARHVVSEMGGTLSVKSKVGSGSTFTLHLPLPDPASIASKVTTQAEKASGAY